MSEVSIIVHVHARPGREDLVGSELHKLLAPTRSEPGCTHYELLGDLRDPAHFVLHETWTSHESHDKHMDSDHVAAFVHACKGAIAEATTDYFEKKG